MHHSHASHRPLRIAQAITEIERLPNLRLVGEVSRCAPPRRATTSSLFSQFYTPDPATPAQPVTPQPQQITGQTTGQATGKNSGSLFVSTQRVFQRRVVPGQTGLTLKDYRVN